MVRTLGRACRPELPRKELSEGGIQALTTDIPNVPRDELQAIPLDKWQPLDEDEFTWESWVKRASAGSR